MVRVVPPSETIARVLPLCEKIGVTRVADVTGLDRTGIPNFTTTRPREAGPGISYYNGKGLTASAAKAGALMEAVERYAGERCDLPIIRGTRDDIRAYGAAIDPRTIVTPLVREYDDRTTLDWVAGYDLMSGRSVLVPLNVVVCPYTPAEGAVKVFHTHTNGLASGNTIEEAICHAICEVIERDAVSIAKTIDDLAPAVRQLCLVGETENPLDPTSVPTTPCRRVDLDSLPPVAKSLVRRMEQAQLRVSLLDASATIGVATLECTCIEERRDGGQVAHGGCGSHPDARVAVNRALTEAAQSRVGHIQGGREDLVDIVSETVPGRLRDLMEQDEAHSFALIPTVEHDNLDDDIRYLLARLSDANFEQVVVVDLTRTELGIPVVRVVIPQAETWSLFAHHDARARLGERANRALSDSVGKLLSVGV